MDPEIRQRRFYGYVFAASKQPKQLYRELKQIPRLTKSTWIIRRGKRNV